MSHDPPTPPERRAAAPPSTPDDLRAWEEVAAFLGRAETHGLAEAPQRIDTHAAAVFLAGPLAYKIKRPVTFPFLDFSTLDRREAACRREIAVDRPIAPQIYRRVVAITREADGAPAIGGDGAPIEWAVEMNRFDETATLDRVVTKGPLAAAFVDDLAATVARMQAHAERRAAEPWIADLGRYLDQNAEAFAARPDLFPPERAAALTRRARDRLAELGEHLRARGRLGFVRLGHGDLHCGNIAVIDGRAQPFDAIEFDDAIATGDILYDAGFLVMDLADRGDRVAARRFLDRLLVEGTRLEVEARIAAGGGPMSPQSIAEAFLERIDGLAALDLFLSIRAALRAKIAAARAPHLADRARHAAEAEARRLFDDAVHHLAAKAPRLTAIGGLSGSGKSRLAVALAPNLRPTPGAVVLRADEIRKLVAGVVTTARLPAAHYTAETSRRVYDLLERAAGRALAAGRSVIVDAVAAKPDERADFAAIAARAEVPFTGLWLDVDESVAAARVGARRGDASDADAAVVHLQRGYDLGPIDWTRIDANGTPEATLAAALAGLERPPGPAGVGRR
jgi:aminoglycoside phosphotransferase family enzyme